MFSLNDFAAGTKPVAATTKKPTKPSNSGFTLCFSSEDLRELLTQASAYKEVLYKSKIRLIVEEIENLIAKNEDLISEWNLKTIKSITFYRFGVVLSTEENVGIVISMTFGKRVYSFLQKKNGKEESPKFQEAVVEDLNTVYSDYINVAQYHVQLK